MEELYNIVNESLNRYFTVLEKTGYVNDSDVKKLILLQYIQEFLNTFQSCITEDDYRIISRIMDCLAGSSCLIPYKQFKQSVISNAYYLNPICTRITENDILRRTQPDMGLRL